MVADLSWAPLCAGTEGNTSRAGGRQGPAALPVACLLVPLGSTMGESCFLGSCFKGLWLSWPESFSLTGSDRVCHRAWFSSVADFICMNFWELYCTQGLWISFLEQGWDTAARKEGHNWKFLCISQEPAISERTVCFHHSCQPFLPCSVPLCVTYLGWPLHDPGKKGGH